MKIVLPFFYGDVHLILKNLDWYAELQPHYDYDLVLACDNQTNPKDVKAKAEKLFRSVECITYPCAYWDNKMMVQWPWPQNNAFANTCRIMSKQSEPWFWCETDVVPLCAGWIDTLAQEYAKGGKPFGGHWNDQNKDYNGMGIFNGVAIYPPRVGKYAKKAITASMEQIQPSWDTYASDQIYPHMHVMNHVMQHMWNLPFQEIKQAPTFPTTNDVAKWVKAGVVLFHRCKDGSLIDRMRELRGKKVEFKGTDVVDYYRYKSKADLFLVSFRRDLEFTQYCLRTVDKFVTGFNKLILLVPKVDEVFFAEIAKPFPFVVLKAFDEVPGKGMVHHEAMVCSADQFCASDYIVHIDSDCAFKELVNIEQEYFRDGKPIMLKERFDLLPAEVRPWQVAVEKALGFTPVYETMRRHPAVHPRWLYPKVREAIEKHTGKPFLEYVLSCENKFPQGFAEFPTLGAWALRYDPGAHYWMEPQVDGRPTDKLRQFWTHGSVDMLYKEEGKTARQIIEGYLNA